MEMSGTVNKTAAAPQNVTGCQGEKEAIKNEKENKQKDQKFPGVRINKWM